MHNTPINSPYMVNPFNLRKKKQVLVKCTLYICGKNAHLLRTWLFTYVALNLHAAQVAVVPLWQVPK